MGYDALMLTRAFSTLGCPELSLDEVGSLAARFQVPQVELRALGGTIELPAYFAKVFGTPAELAERVAALPARPVALDTSFRLLDAGEPERAKLLEFLPWAPALGVRWLRVFDGGKQLDAAAIERAAGNLNWWRTVRQERGVAADFMIETHDVLLNTANILRFIEAMPPESVRLLWDTHHTWRRGGEDPLATWRAIGAHVVHAHVKDSVSEPGDRQPFTYALPGAGEFPMAALLNVLREEFDGAVSLEWERLWHPELAPLEEALRSAADTQWW